MRRYHTYPPHSCMRRELYAYLLLTHRAPTGAVCVLRGRPFDILGGGGGPGLFSKKISCLWF